MNDKLKELADLMFPNVTKTIADYEKMYPERNLKAGARVTRFAPSPTGFVHMGSLLSAYEDYKAAKDTDGNKATAIVNGREQTIFKCSSGYYLWHGAENKYYRLTRAECIQNGIYVDKWYDQ